MFHKFLWAILICLALTASLQASSFVNGDFETGTAAGGPSEEAFGEVFTTTTLRLLCFYRADLCTIPLPPIPTRLS